MFNKTYNMGTKRALDYFQAIETNGDPLVLLGYYQEAGSNNLPWPGETEDYKGDPMPDEYLQQVIDICFEYFGTTFYSNPSRLTPPNPAIGQIRYRDCSSFVWDVLNRVGFKIGGLWYTASQYQVLKDYQIPASERQAGDIIIYWKTAGAPIGGNAEHTMIYIGNEWHIDVTGHTKYPQPIPDACQQRNNYNYDNGYCRFFRIPPSMYPS